MNRSDFNKLVEERFEKIRNTLIKKGQEYSGDEDVFYSFKRTGQIGNITPQRALWGFMLKHFTSISDIVDDLDNEIYTSEEVIDEKLGDLLNYFILLEGLLKNKQ